MTRGGRWGWGFGERVILGFGFGVGGKGEVSLVFVEVFHGSEEVRFFKGGEVGVVVQVPLDFLLAGDLFDDAGGIGWFVGWGEAFGAGVCEDVVCGAVAVVDVDVLELFFEFVDGVVHGGTEVLGG